MHARLCSEQAISVIALDAECRRFDARLAAGEAASHGIRGRDELRTGRLQDRAEGMHPCFSRAEGVLTGQGRLTIAAGDVNRTGVAFLSVSIP